MDQERIEVHLFRRHHVHLYSTGETVELAQWVHDHIFCT